MSERVSPLLVVQVLLAAVAVALHPEASRAGAYRYTKIADSAGSILPSYPTASISNSGRVAFFGQYAGSSRYGLFTGDGGPLTTIMTVPDDWPSDHPYGSPWNFSMQDPGMESNGTAIFMDTGWTGWMILAGNGGPVTTLLDDTGPFESFDAFGPQVNEHGTLVFLAHRDSGEAGVFVWDQGSVITVADNTSTFTGFAPAPTINNLGTVLFEAQTDTGEIGIFTYESGSITRIVDNSGPLAHFAVSDPNGGDHDINDAGQIVFSAARDDNSTGVFTIRDGQLTSVVDDSGEITRFVTRPFINNQGLIVYGAELDDGTIGLFTGPDFSADSVVKTGDALDGSTVVLVLSWGHGLNDLGQVAFMGFLQDGRRGIYVASPEAVPEPCALILLGMGVVPLVAYGTLVSRRRKRSG